MEIGLFNKDRKTSLCVAVRKKGLFRKRYYLTSRENDSLESLLKGLGIDYSHERAGSSNCWQDPYHGYRKILKKRGLLDSTTQPIDYFILSGRSYKKLKEYSASFEKAPKKIVEQREEESKPVQEKQPPLREISPEERLPLVSEERVNLKAKFVEKYGIPYKLKSSATFSQPQVAADLSPRDEEIFERRAVNFLEKSGIMPALLDYGEIEIGRNSHIGSARGRDAVNRLCRYLKRLGIEDKDIEKVMSDYSGKIRLTSEGKARLSEIRERYGAKLPKKGMSINSGS